MKKLNTYYSLGDFIAELVPFGSVQANTDMFKITGPNDINQITSRSPDWNEILQLLNIVYQAGKQARSNELKALIENGSQKED